MNSYIERKGKEFISELESVGWEYDYGGRKDANTLKKWAMSALQEQQEMIIKSFISHIMSRKEKGYEDRTIIEELENNFILEGIIRDISE